MRDGWAKLPTAFKGLLPPGFAARDWGVAFRGWCRSPARARVFVLTEDAAPGSAKAYDAPRPSEGLAVFDDYATEGERLTLLLNSVERVSPEVVAIRDALGVGLDWRHDDVVATLSTAGSGIGYHAGHEDGFIVQLAGRRIWRVWSPALLPDHYRLGLLGHPNPAAAPPPRPTAPPCGEFRLEAGDVLHIPALFGHEGITEQDSISLSIAWRGLTCYGLLKGAGQPIQDLGRAAVESPEVFFSLLPDPPPGHPSPTAFISDAACERLSRLKGPEPWLGHMPPAVAKMIGAAAERSGS